MCGRYTLTVQGRLLIHELDDVRIEIRDLIPRYNLSPGQTAPVIRLEGGQTAVATLRWGLIPGWARDPKIAFQCINARAETVATKPAFRSAFRQRRCLVPADGFFEWQKSTSGKLPWRFVRPDHGVFFFAGLWESWSPNEATAPVETFTVITTEPNADTRPVHDRMPVILSGATLRSWLDPAAPVESLTSLLRPAPDGFLERHRVSTFVNSSRHEGPDCIAPIPEDPGSSKPPEAGELPLLSDHPTDPLPPPTSLDYVRRP